MSEEVDKAPRKNEEELWQWIMTAAETATRTREDEAEFNQFGDNIDIYDGKHWPKTMPSFKPPVVANELRTLILSEASDLTEAQLRIFVSKDRSKGNRDENRERALMAVWRREQIDLKLMLSVVWALVTGTGFIETAWDPDSFGGFGDVAVNVRDPRTVLPDPDSVDDKHWSHVITESVLPLFEIRRLWPHSGARVEPEDSFSTKDEVGTKGPGMSSSFYRGPLTSTESLLGRNYPGYKSSSAKVFRVLLKDPTIEERHEVQYDLEGKPLKGEDGSDLMATKLYPKYPEGRLIVAANRVILADGPNPTPGGDFGLLRILLEPALGKFWGRGFIHQTKELQIAADKLLSSTVENALRLNNGIVKMTTNTGLDMESFAGIPAQVVQINPGSEFEIMYPQPMPPDMIQAPDRYLNLQRRILGFQDSRSGTSGRGNVSADLTESEISQAQAVTRLRSRMLYSTVQRLADQIFARMVYGYKTTRAIPAVEGESWKPAIWEPVDEADTADYRVHVDQASFEVMSKTMLRRLGMGLFKLRAIDRKALLERVQWPDADQVADRMAKAELAQAQAKAMAKKGSK